MWEYRAHVLEVVDGDSVHMVLDLGMNVWHRVELRLLNVFAPEKTQPGGPETKTFVQQWFAQGAPGLTWPYLVTTTKDNKTEPDEKRTFTRWVATVQDIGQQRTLNTDVANFLAEHPDWGGGIGGAK